MVKNRNAFTRGFLFLLALCLLALPGSSSEARRWMLADQRVWTVTRACTDGVIVLMAHQESYDPDFVPGEEDAPAWVELGVRKITNPAAPLPEINGDLSVPQDSYGTLELVPFQVQEMIHHTNPLILDISSSGSKSTFHYYDLVKLSWPGSLVPGTDRVIVVGGKFNRPDAFTGMVAGVEDCRVNQFAFARQPVIQINGARFPSVSPHLKADLPLYHGSQPSLGVVKVNTIPLTNPFRQEDINNSAVTYSAITPILESDLLTLRAIDIVRASVASDGTQTNNQSIAPKISRNGRFIAFSSLASNLQGGDDFHYQIYRHDRDADQNGFFDEAGGISTVHVSPGLSGTVSSDRVNPDISGDGNFVAFNSSETNLVLNDTNGKADVFVWANGTVLRVSLAANGTEANGDSQDPTISENGRFIAFRSDATNLVPGISTAVNRIYLRDRDTDNDGTFDEPGAVSTILISKNNQGDPANDHCAHNSISADGRYLVYDCLANNLVADDTNASSDVFLFDRQTNQVERVSRTWDGQQVDQPSFIYTGRAISDDGRFVVFDSSSGIIAADFFDGNGVEDVFVRDRAAGQTRIVSYNNQRSGPGNSLSWSASISGNGRRIAFFSLADDLVLSDEPACRISTVPLNCADVFIFDQESNDTILANINANAVQGNTDASPPGLSGDGSFVVFSSNAHNLVAQDDNNTYDIFAAYAGFPFSFPILAEDRVFLFLPAVSR